MAEARLLLQGTEYIIGVQIGDRSIRDILNETRKLDGKGLISLAKKGDNFLLCLTPGKIVFLPSGYMFSSFFTVETQGIRWCHSPAGVDEENRVKRAAANLLEVRPSLRQTTYMNWYDSFGK